MQTTFDLYIKAIKAQSKAELARKVGVHVTTWTRVESEKHLPPTVAGKVAIAMDENPRDWITLAHIEAIERKQPDEAKALRKACRYL
jgi:DNA-binding XRE family transcriptional regulator